MPKYQAELTYPRGAQYSLAAFSAEEMARKIARLTENRRPLADATAISKLRSDDADPLYLHWPDGWSARVWVD